MGDSEYLFVKKAQSTINEYTYHFVQFKKVIAFTQRLFMFKMCEKFLSVRNSFPSFGMCDGCLLLKSHIVIHLPGIEEPQLYWSCKEDDVILFLFCLRAFSPTHNYFLFRTLLEVMFRCVFSSNMYCYYSTMFRF